MTIKILVKATNKILSKGKGDFTVINDRNN